MSIATLICAAGILTACTNVITQVIKQITREIVSTNIVAFVVAEALTILSGAMYCRAGGTEADAMTIVVLLFAGCAVAYAAMFGYDKLKEVLGWDDDSGDAEIAQELVEEVLAAAATQGQANETEAVESDAEADTTVQDLTAVELEAMTKAELKALLDQMGISYTTKNTKAELIALALWPQL